jgi:hypothetical protein
MKRILFSLTLVFSLISFNSFANDNKVSDAVLESFKSSFSNVSEVSWTVSENYYKASFAMGGRDVSAFYSHDGKMIAISRNVSSTELPILLQASLMKAAEGSWISDLFEVSSEDGTTYYATLENSETKTVLKATPLSGWQSYQKNRKS